MKKISRRSFLASSVKAAMFSGFAAKGGAFAQSASWSNWSGGQTCQPAGRYDISSEQQLTSLLRNTLGPIRPVGSGHSFSALVPTDGHLVVIDQLSGILDSDAQTKQVTLGAGSRLGDLGAQLEAIGQGMINLPDIDRQTVAGAIATGTHGTGVTLQALSSFITSLRLITPNGNVMDIDSSDEDLLHAARVNVGALGIVTQVTMQNRESYKLKKREWAAPTEDILANFDELAASHRHFEIFPLVYSDYSLVLSIDETDEPIGQSEVEEEPSDDASIAESLGLSDNPTPAERLRLSNATASRIQPTEAVDVSHKILSNVRNSRFNEMEYSVPAEVGAECLREILKTIYDEAIDVQFVLEYRYVGADDDWLSMSYGDHPHATISIHRTASADYRPYFNRIEPIFWKYGGRPHWGKVHNLTHVELTELYPRFKDFMELRRELDPQGRMLNPHLRALFNA
ncbi:MAG: FAD-binding protein [Gammaproteobacteria bacterium]|jgi:FAD-linked oxidoreductase|nr:FAD-binding protein [Gammaproteobacteria bacterium]MBT6482458.1 FAD-binding protein [Gammaproteobacteria bacterium]MBT7226585.1 FAD-binding protein [Gammaproteobacteria bacterium]